MKKSKLRYFLDNSKFLINGISNETGFCLTLTDSSESRIKAVTINYKVATTNYRASADVIPKRTFLIYSIQPILTIAILILVINALPNFLSSLLGWTMLITGIFLCTAICQLASAFIQLKIGNQDILEWHACEHKSFILLKSGLDPTIEALKQCPSDTIWCGGSWMTILGELILYPWTATFLTMAFPESLFMQFASLILMIFTMSAFMLFFLMLASSLRLCPNLYRSPLVVTLIKPAAIIPLAVQRFFTTKEPSKRKLAETAALLQNFIAKQP